MTARLAEMNAVDPEGEYFTLSALASGKEMTFTIAGDKEPKTKLSLRLREGGR